MFQRILVPTDFSKRTSQALAVAINIAKQDRGVIDLLHVIEMIVDTTFEEFEEFYLKLEDRAREDMDSLIAQYGDMPVEINQKILYGDRSRQILQFAAENESDLIIMNSHKVDRDNPVSGWGTISYKVVILSECPVMLIK
jgi:universal stress protein A